MRVKDVKADTLLKEAIRNVKRGSLIYTDRFKSYDGLVMYGFRHERIRGLLMGRYISMG